MQEAYFMESLWSESVSLEKHKKLKEDLRCQNVVIGAGIAGLLIAYLLQAFMIPILN